jgi:hypothetical protein
MIRSEIDMREARFPWQRTAGWPEGEQIARIATRANVVSEPPERSGGSGVPAPRQMLGAP